MKQYLVGEIADLNPEGSKASAVIAPDYEVDESGLLFFCPRSATQSEDRTTLARWVIPELLQPDFLHHFHTSVEGDHQGIGRTYQRIPAISMGENFIEACSAM